jgi:type IV pilus assembly protein PilV
MKTQHPSRAARGFSLVEVLVALVVLSVGLLGIAKMQALGLSSNSVAGKRALAAVQADSLAAAMHENRAFWSSPAAINTWTASPLLVPSCAVGGGGAPCGPQALANYDLMQWAQSLNLLLPNAVGTVICQFGVAGSVVTCQVTINWSEKTIGIDANAAALATAVAGTNVPTYTLFVEP